MNRRETGNAAEALAADFLSAKGMRLLAQHYAMRGGEIDLILQDGRYVVFAEVKYRTGDAFGMPREAVTLAKQRRIVRTAAKWLAQQGRMEDFVRFDVVEVTPQGITHLPHAFDASILT